MNARHDSTFSWLPTATTLARSGLRLIGLGVLTAAMTACAPHDGGTASDRTVRPASLTGNTIALLGEIHDNAALHAQRLTLLRAAVEAGWRPVITMEQFDIDRQVDIERARAERPDDVDHLIEHAATRPGEWDWAHYRPVLALALQYRLPIRAANLARRDAARLVRSDFETVLGSRRTVELGLDRGIDTALQAAQEREIDQGHCGALPASVLPGMARAQIARDAIMADVLRRAGARGAVLLAGNGHVRRDLGVPRWLADIPAARILVIGFVEPGMEREATDRYDRVLTNPGAAMVRPTDPCAVFRQR